MRRLLAAVAMVSAAVVPWTAEALPDLTCSVKGPQQAVQPNPNGSVTLSFDVELKNIGTEACPGQWFTDFWPTYPCPCDVPPLECVNLVGGELWDSETFFTLGPGQIWSPGSITEDVFPNYQPYRYLLFVDSVFNFCTEEDETNNMCCGEYYLLPAGQVVNLDLSNCSVEVDYLNPVNALFKVDVTNTGTKETPEPTHVDFFLVDPGTQPNCSDCFYQDGDAFAVVPAGLQPGEKITVEAVLPDVAPGTYVPYSIVNSFKEIEESNWADNCCNFNKKPYTQPGEVQQPDLVSVEAAGDVSDSIVEWPELVAIEVVSSEPSEPSVEGPDLIAVDAAGLDLLAVEATEDDSVVGGDCSCDMAGTPMPGWLVLAAAFCLGLAGRRTRRTTRKPRAR